MSFSDRIQAESSIPVQDASTAEFLLGSEGEVLYAIQPATDQTLGKLAGFVKGLMKTIGESTRRHGAVRFNGNPINITGTITSSGTAVTGVGTAFLTELNIGDYIVPGSGANAGVAREIQAIGNDTSLTLYTAWAADIGVGVTASRVMTLAERLDKFDRKIPIIQSPTMLLENNSGDAANDIDFKPGRAVASAGDHSFRSLVTVTKRTDAAWVAGTGNGGMFYGAKVLSTTNRARTSNQATLTVASGHGYTSGDSIIVLSVGGSGYNTGASFPNYVNIVSVTATSITYNNAGSNEGTTADTGGIILPKWLHCFVIGDVNNLTDGVDFGFCFHRTPTSLPTGYNRYKRLGSILITAVATGDIAGFYQSSINPDYFELSVTTKDTTLNNIPHAASQTLWSSAPPLTEGDVGLHVEDVDFAGFAHFYRTARPSPTNGGYTAYIHDGQPEVSNSRRLWWKRIQIDEDGIFNAYIANGGVGGSGNMDNMACSCRGWFDKRLD